MPSDENSNKLTPLKDIYKRMEELKRIYTLVEAKKNTKVPEWIEKLTIAIVTFDKMTWLNGLLNGIASDVEEYVRERQFLDFLQDIFLCQALFFLPSCPCEHIIKVSQNLNVVCMHGRDIQLRIECRGVESYLLGEIDTLKNHLTERTNQQNGDPQRVLNSRCILRSDIGNLLSRL